ncbi:MAG: hypothetical protein V1867_01780 [Candidatus Falkowbacteria bacterium]
MTEYSLEEICGYLTDKNEKEVVSDGNLTAIIAARHAENGYSAIRYVRRALFKRCCGERVLILKGLSDGVKVRFYMTFYVCARCGRVECRTHAGLRYAHDMKKVPSPKPGNVIYFRRRVVA